jgi:hypothetical protein
VRRRVENDGVDAAMAKTSTVVLTATAFKWRARGKEAPPKPGVARARPENNEVGA